MLQDSITEIQGQYQEANDAFNQILKWKEFYEAPTTLQLYARKEKLRHQFFFDTWKPFLKDI
jgi:hypothetical protein